MVGQDRGIEATPEIGHMTEAKSEMERVKIETDPVVERKDKD